MRRFPILITVALVTFALAAVPVLAADEMAAPAAADEMAAPAAPLKTGDTLPAAGLQVADLDGKMAELKVSLTDKDFTFFQFMTTACSACQAEMMEFVGLQAEFSGKFDIVAISMDMMGAAAVNRYETKFKYGVKYLLDPEFKLPPRFNFAYTPSFFIADKTGKIVHMKGGFMASRWSKERKKIVEIIQ